MIISASRRTDIPAFYSEWFMDKIRAGHVLCRNPMNRKQVSKVNLSPDVVDCIVFWTKNPHNILKYLDELKDYNYYFQITISSYDKSIEPNVPLKSEILKTVKKLSNLIGFEKIIWRYDPIFYTKKFNLSYHVENFEKLAQALNGYTEKCVISFVDTYRKYERNMRNIDYFILNNEEVFEVSKRLSEISEKYNIKLESCAEKYDFSSSNIKHSKCIDDELISRIANKPIKVKKDKNQREECGCVTSIDIGTYNTCLHNCLYCYANENKDLVQKNHKKYKAHSAFIDGELKGDEKITERKVKSLFSDIEKEQMDLSL
ncbi:MAG: DUF1848 domain-containing protein [Victivallales bacterium]|nr:DUF1848 domain-containing protein [Victivallales bacterium]